MVTQNILQAFSIFGAFLLLLTSCGGGGEALKARQALRQQFKSRDYQQFLSSLKDNDFYNHEKNRGLLWLEKAMAYHELGQFQKSINELNRAREFFQKANLKVGDKAGRYLLNESSSVYRAETYEMSQIYFYLVLNHFLRWSSDSSISSSEKNAALGRARAEVLAWDSYLESTWNKKKGEVAFKNDLMAKILGGMIHEAIGKREELEIALQLYRDAKNLLIKNYSSYRSYNHISTEYRKNFSRFHRLGERAVQTQYIRPTVFATELTDFLDYKLLQMTRLIRPREYGLLKNKKNKLNSLLGQRDQANINVIIQGGLIPSKVGETQYFGLERAIHSKDPGARAAARIGAAVLTVFAAQKLRLLPPPSMYSPAGSYLGIKVAEMAATHAAISFELPKIQARPIKSTSELLVYDQAKKMVAQRPMILSQPLGDLAEMAIAETSAGRYFRTGMRLAIKHIAAIVAAYGTYKAMKGRKNDNDFLARNAAVAQYVLSTKAIQASEKADIRYWSTLPWQMRFGHIQLPSGVYHFKLKWGDKVYQLGQRSIVKGQSYLINKRLF